MKGSFSPKIIRQQFNRIPNGAAFFIPSVAGGSTGTGPFVKMSSTTYMAANTIPTSGSTNMGTAMSSPTTVIIRAEGWMSRSATLPAR